MAKKIIFDGALKPELWEKPFRVLGDPEKPNDSFLIEITEKKDGLGVDIWEPVTNANLKTEIMLYTAETLLRRRLVGAKE